MICFTDRVENIVGKGENAGYQHFHLFPQCFQQASVERSFTFGILWWRVMQFFVSTTGNKMPLENIVEKVGN